MKRKILEILSNLQISKNTRTLLDFLSPQDGLNGIVLWHLKATCELLMRRAQDSKTDKQTGQGSHETVPLVTGLG